MISSYMKNAFLVTVGMKNNFSICDTANITVSNSLKINRKKAVPDIHQYNAMDTIVCN